MDGETVARYLDRIGEARIEGASAAWLGTLQVAHLLTVPFENLSIHLGDPIILAEGPIIEKMVDRRRGGFCYELNGAFALLLQAVGFDVTLLAARVFGRNGLGPPLDHLVLRVNAGRDWLVDVGFGDHSMEPLVLDDRGHQQDRVGVFQVVEGPGGDLDVTRDGVAQYRIELRPRAWVDFEPMCWWHQTSPRSHFTQNLVCSLALSAGRVTLSDDRLIRTVDGERTEEALATDEDVLAAYRSHFGLVLEHRPRVRTV